VAGAAEHVGMALPLAVGVATAMFRATRGSNGRLNVAFSDSDEPYAQRARRMLASSGLVGLAVLRAR